MKTILLSLLLALPLSTPIAADVAPTVAREQDSFQFLIPVAGNVAGANGEHFRTNLTIVNYRNTAQTVDVAFVPQTGAPVSTRLEIPYLTNLTFVDIVGAHLGASGLGALVVTAIHPSGESDTSAMIDGNARIWTPQRNGIGEISSYVGGQLLHGWSQNSPAYIPGTRRTSQFRTNYGIVNLDLQNPRSFRVIVNSGLGRYEETVELRPFSMVQRPVSGTYGDLSIYVEPLGTGGPWHAYGTSTDNVSGSTWVVPGMQPRVEIVFP
ncbi:MAG TPA: hypothetical protein VFV54_01935 [Thermoanaerobaculia bacterium]|nr:hypothetical protein [Thermoanaerobaculia bacterium]